MDRLRATFKLDEKRQLVGQIGLTNYDVLGQIVFDACCAGVEGQRIEVDTSKPVVPTAGSTSLRWRR